MLKQLCAGFMALMMSLVVSAAEGDKYQEGVHYAKLPFAVHTADPAKVEVVEMFGYPCPHCNAFEPLIHSWSEKQTDDVQFVRIPVVFGRSWEPLARAYYVAELLDVVDQTHQAVFDAIHMQKKRFAGKDELAEFYGGLGVDSDQFAKLYDSFAVNTKLSQGESKARSYEITGVPTMVVNGKYRITAAMAGGHRQMLDVVNYLVEQEREAM